MVRGHVTFLDSHERTLSTRPPFDPLESTRSGPRGEGTAGEWGQENPIPMSPFLCHDLMSMQALTGDGVNDGNTDGHRFASLSQMGTDSGGGRSMKNGDEGSSRPNAGRVGKKIGGRKRNQRCVFLHWEWSYFTWQRGARVIQSSRDR